MSNDLPSVTVIVPTRPGEGVPLALAAAQSLDYPRDKMEIIVARGKQPAVQRNLALKTARGDLIYFLDDDSVPRPDNLRKAVKHFSDSKVVMLGGPNLCPENAPLLEQVFAVCLASWLAFGPSRARYDQVGAVRATSEKELILCNQMARRQVLLDAGGFDESLYPNEENALMDELQKRGGILLYDPDFTVSRRPRPSLKAFCRMLINYGRGRAEQFRLHPTPGSALNFVPPLFCAYLLLAMAGCLILPTHALWVLLPLMLYFLTLIAQTACSVSSKGLGRSLAALPLLFLTHLFYGLGFWRGLFTQPKSATRGTVGPVTLEKLSELKS